MNIRKIPARLNPTPLQRVVDNKNARSDRGDVDFQELLDGIIGEEYLKGIAETDDLSTVSMLQLKVNTSIQSIHEITEYLPNLNSLILDTSLISTIRDLGVGFRNLVCLSLNDCGLNDLDGIGALSGLQNLSLTDNDISDAAPLAMQENLEVLNLSGNKISDLSIADALSSCPVLRSLFLSRNVVERMPKYRLIIASLIPGLEMLDGSPVDPQAQTKVTNGMIIEAASMMSLVLEDIEDEQRMEMLLVEDDDYIAGAKSSSTDNHAVSASESGSDLTYGQHSGLMAGNVALAMRRRRARTQQTQESIDTTSHASCEDEKGGEGESAISVLDSALQCQQRPALGGGRVGSAGGAGPGGLRASGDMETLPFFSEGDITEAVAMHLGIINFDGTDDEEEGGHGHGEESAVSPRRARPSAALTIDTRPTSAATSSSSSSSSPRPGTASRRTEPLLTNIASSPMLRRPPSRAGSARPGSAKGSASTGVSSSYEGIRGSVDGSSVRPSSRNGSSSGASVGRVGGEDGGRPRSSRPGTSNSSGNSEGELSRPSSAWSRKNPSSASLIYSSEGEEEGRALGGGGASNRTRGGSREGLGMGTGTASSSRTSSRRSSRDSEADILVLGEDGETLFQHVGSSSSSSSAKSRSKGLPPPSPRQHNSSRPQTAESTGSGSGIAPSAPFLVAADKAELKALKAKVNIGRRSEDSPPHFLESSSSSNSFSAAAEDSRPHNKKKTSAFGVFDQRSENGSGCVGSGRSSRREAISSDDDDDDLPLMRRKTAAALTMSPRKAPRARTSLVHLDMVRRSVEADFLELDNDEDEDDLECSSERETAPGSLAADYEGIAVNHAARHRLMSASGRRPGAASSTTGAAPLFTTSGSAPVLGGTGGTGDVGDVGGTHGGTGGTGATQGAVEKKSSAAGGDCAEVARPDSGASGCTGRGGATVRGGASKNSVPSSSSMAGMSLGFDLKGSLAAIEQWVDQMESEEEQDEEIEAMGKEERHGKGAAKKFVRPGSSRGILMDKDAKEAKILSRDKIISMCAGVSSSASDGLDFAVDDSDDEQVRRREVGYDDNDEEDMDVALLRDLKVQAREDSSQGLQPFVHQQRPLSSAGNRPPVFGAPVSTNAGKATPSVTIVPSKGVAEKMTIKTVKAGIDFTRGDKDRLPVTSSTASSELKSNSGLSRRSEDDVDERISSPSDETAATAKVFGEGVFMSDADLVVMLRLPPKSTPALRTKSSFQEFFRGIKSKRIEILLAEAYQGSGDADEQAQKVSKRMELLRDVVS